MIPGKKFKQVICPKCQNSMLPGIMMENVDGKIVAESWLSYDYIKPGIFKEAQNLKCIQIIGFACKECGYTEQYIDVPALYEDA